MIEAPEVDVAALGPLEKIGGGGQGQVFALRDNADGPVYKEYSPRVVDDLDIEALRRFVRFVHELDESDQIALLGRVAWPEVIVRRDGVVRGFLMRRVPPEFTAELRFGAEVSRELALVQYLLNPPSYLADRGLEITTRLRLEILRDTADALALFHRLGISVGDLSPNNLLFSLTARPRCFFVDPDGMRLGEDSVLSQVETPDWRVGDVGDEELGTPASDVYKFGLLAVRLFASDQQATDPVVVPGQLRSRVAKCLSAAPHDRPAASALVTPLDRSLKNLREPAVPPPRPPEPEPAPEPEPEREPVRPRVVPVAAGPAPRRSWWPLLFAVIPIAIGVLFGLADDSSGNLPSGVGPLGPLTPAVPPTRFGLPDLAPPTLITGLPRLPGATDILGVPSLPPLSLNPDLTCLLSVSHALEVQGGPGLSQVESAVGLLLCGANAEARAGLTPSQPALRDHAPYSSARIVGFFGEGMAFPTATVDFTSDAGACRRTSIGFDGGYSVRSVGPMSPC